MLTLLAIVTINADPFKHHLQHLATTLVVFILLTDAAQVSVISSIIGKESNSTNSFYTFYVFAAVVSLLPIFYFDYIAWLWIIHHCNLKWYRM